MAPAFIPKFVSCATLPFAAKTLSFLTCTTLSARSPATVFIVAFWNCWASSAAPTPCLRSEEHTSELQSQFHLVCRLLLEKKNHHIIFGCSLHSRLDYNDHFTHIVIGVYPTDFWSVYKRKQPRCIKTTIRNL